MERESEEEDRRHSTRWGNAEEKVEEEGREEWATLTERPSRRKAITILAARPPGDFRPLPADPRRHVETPADASFPPAQQIKNIRRALRRIHGKNMSRTAKNPWRA